MYQKTKYQEFQELQKLLENQPLPKIDEEWTLPSSPWYKPLKVRILSYENGYGEMFTLHSGQTVKKTEHWIKKKYYYSKLKFGNPI